MEWEGVYWISVAQVGDSSWASVNRGMNLNTLPTRWSFS